MASSSPPSRTPMQQRFAVAIRPLVEALSERAGLKEFACFVGRSEYSAADKDALIRTLLHSIVQPDATMSIVRASRALVIVLVARLTSARGVQAYSRSAFEATAHALARILLVCRSATGLVLSYFRRSPSLFDRLTTIDVSSIQQQHQQHQQQHHTGADTTSDTDAAILSIIETAHLLLRIDAHEFAQVWNWAPTFALLSHPNDLIRWHAAMCITTLLRCNNAVRERVVHLSTTFNPEQASNRHQEFLRLVTEHDALERALLTVDTPTSLDPAPSASHADHDQLATSTSELSDSQYLTLKDFDCANLVDVCGLLLEKRQLSSAPSKKTISDEDEDTSTTRDTSKGLALTPTTQLYMRALALALSHGNPILLEGVTGAGKTCMIDELARLTNNTDVIKIHLGDQSDAKTLLGSYVCTDIPGEFRWQPGALTQAVQRGSWIVIEDIDLAPMDVISVIMPLLETRQLFIPGRAQEIPAAYGFQIFATQTLIGTGEHRGTRSHNVGKLLDKFWTRIVVEVLSLEELHQVLEQAFPPLQPLLPLFLKTFQVLQATDTATSSQNSKMLQATASSRHFSTRDLFKWCKRVCRAAHSLRADDAVVTNQVRELIFNEAVDCFAGAIANQEQLRKSVTDRIAGVWGISVERIHYYATMHKPIFQVTTTTVSIGRVTLAQLNANKDTAPAAKFAHTMHSLLLMERIAVSLSLNEPILLVGETGTGKTTVVQYLAQNMGQRLIVLNLSQQTDSSDLLGGFKPVELRLLCLPIKNAFERLFPKTFSKKANADFLEQVKRAFATQNWKQFIRLLQNSVRMVEAKYLLGDHDEDDSSSAAPTRKPMKPELRERWRKLMATLAHFELQHDQLKNSFAFTFVEGALVKAVRNGHWVLLDEANLASTETLESLSGLLEGGSLYLTERGDIEPVHRHPNFRIFACMNPATDVGKKELPPGLRNRFTEFYVSDMSNKEDLCVVVSAYLKSVTAQPPIESIVEFYLSARAEVESCKLADGANQKPHFSLRTLCRALSYVVDATSRYGFQRALYDGFAMSFLTQLNRPSYIAMEALIRKHLLKSSKPISFTAPKQPTDGSYVQFDTFWIEAGSLPPVEPASYILTPTIKQHIRDLARIVLFRKFPVLLQGPTSSGKTSMVEYLAHRTGHRFVRINNHEHTDLQEYLGTYVSDTQGNLVFQEGILVEALRNGYWVVLDELNLAPSEVLEALNRLLDDNRELFIPETQQIVKPHPHFMLFATQNPPGLYGGRKLLSRAFRNRFLELHFEDIPDDELEEIISQRCAIPPSYCKKLVLVMKDLQRRRQGTKVFAGKHGFITLRDLFRWAERHPNGYDELAQHGYMLLAERLRKDEEKLIIKQVLEQHLGVKLNVDAMYECSNSPDYLALQQALAALPEDQRAPYNIVWTKSMKRLFTLVGHCLRHKEPVLLVGETGCGKTTVCQLYGLLQNVYLHILNCHQHTETADFLGGLRPVRGKSTIVSTLCTSIVEYLRLRSTIISGDADHQQAVPLELEDASDAASGVDDEARVTRLLEHYSNVLQAATDQEADRMAIGDSPAVKAELERRANEIAELHRQYRALFQWHDGPLVTALKEGHLFLIDEVSLAEDSVLERLNSVLEPKRMLVLAEKGGGIDIEEYHAHERFRIFATMNPGGDFGKKELSPALRNRFTELWVTAASVDGSDDQREELRQVVLAKLKHERLVPLATLMIEFMHWFSSLQRQHRVISLRDLLAWVEFLNSMLNARPESNIYELYLHGACLVLLDGLGTAGVSSADEHGSKRLRLGCFERLLEQVPESERHAILTRLDQAGDIRPEFLLAGLATADVVPNSCSFGCEPFVIARGPLPPPQRLNYSLRAPTTARNLVRLLRALQLGRKPILLEGSPGVGKTSLVTALAAASGHRVVRINLSEQTDMMDLLGSDLPTEGGTVGQFGWCDGVFLQALKAGDWVLLDELNLASQSVLEGLNAVLDHRATVYIAELDREFVCAPGFRVFACQNPTQQGGGRKGLPKSFLNRFTQVYVDKFDAADLRIIATSMFPSIDPTSIESMIEFNTRLYHETMVLGRFARAGTPWEFNLRDVFRWCELVLHSSGEHPARFVNLVYQQRMRSESDRQHIARLYRLVFPPTTPMAALPERVRPSFTLSPTSLQVGDTCLPRATSWSMPPGFEEHCRTVLQQQLPALEALMQCVQRNWMAICIGGASSGKTSLVQLLAQLTGNPLRQFWMNSSVDTTELLGGFEQVDLRKRKRDIIDRISLLLMVAMQQRLFLAPSSASDDNTRVACKLSQLWATFLLRYTQTSSPSSTVSSTSSSASSSSSSSSSSVLVEESNQPFHEAEAELLSRVLQELEQHQQRDCATTSSDEERAMLASVRTDLEHLQLLNVKRVTGSFEWIDGTLIQALEQGHWLLIDNVNFCNPTVLDRLNPLLEEGGVLMVNERGLVDGSVKIIKPHPNFRIFLTMDPANGEISRAMRNRGIEIFVPPLEVCSRDTVTLLNESGIPGVELPALMAAFHQQASETMALTPAIEASKPLAGHHNNTESDSELLLTSRVLQHLSATPETSKLTAPFFTVRELQLWATLVLELLERGSRLVAALSEAMEQVYVRHVRSLRQQDRLRRVFQQLLGPLVARSHNSATRWPPVVSSIIRHCLGGLEHPLVLDSSHDLSASIRLSGPGGLWPRLVSGRLESLDSRTAAIYRNTALVLYLQSIRSAHVLDREVLVRLRTAKGARAAGPMTSLELWNALRQWLDSPRMASIAQVDYSPALLNLCFGACSIDSFAAQGTALELAPQQRASFDDLVLLAARVMIEGCNASLVTAFGDFLRSFERSFLLPAVGEADDDSTALVHNGSTSVGEVADMLAHTFAHPLAARVVAVRDALLAELGVSDELVPRSSLPIDLRANLPLWQFLERHCAAPTAPHHRRWLQLTDALRSLLVLVDRVAKAAREEQFYTAAQTSLRTDAPLLRSFFVSIERIAIKDAHPLEVLLLPLFRQFDAFVSHWLSTALEHPDDAESLDLQRASAVGLTALLHARDELWRSVARPRPSSNVYDEHFLLCWRSFCKRFTIVRDADRPSVQCTVPGAPVLESASDKGGSLAATMIRLASLIEERGHYWRPSMLWRTGGHPAVLHQEGARTLQLRIVTAAVALERLALQTRQSVFSHELKRSVTQALCTLMGLDLQDRNPDVPGLFANPESPDHSLAAATNQLLDSIGHVPVLLERELQRIKDKLRSDQEAAALRELADGTGAEAAAALPEVTVVGADSLVPLLDFANVLHEGTLIGRLHQAIYHVLESLLSAQQLKTSLPELLLIEPVASHVAAAYQQTSRSPLDLVPFQSWVWLSKSPVLEAAAYASEGDLPLSNKLRVLLAALPTLVGEMEFHWHRRLWNNTFSDLSTLLRSVLGAKARKERLAAEAAAAAEQSSTIDPHVAGSCRLFQSPQSVVAMAYLQPLSALALRDRTDKLKQLAILNQHFSTTSFVDAPAADRAHATGVLAHLVAATGSTATLSDSAWFERCLALATDAQTEASSFRWAAQLDGILHGTVKALIDSPDSLPQTVAALKAIGSLMSSVKIKTAAIGVVASSGKQQTLSKAQQRRQRKKQQYSSASSASSNVQAECADQAYANSIVLLPEEQRTQYEQMQRAKTWILLGMVRLHVLLPASDVDPTSKYTVKLKSILEAIEQLKREITLRVAAVATCSTAGIAGSAASDSILHAQPVIGELYTRLQELEQAAARIRPKTTARPEPPQFAHLYQELRQFAHNFARPEMVLGLANEIEHALLHGQLVPGSQCTRESMWQEKGSHVVESLRERFSHYQDLLQPIMTSILQIKHGLRLLRTAEYSPQRLHLERLLVRLSSFPTAEAQSATPFDDSLRRLLGIDTATALRAVLSLSAATSIQSTVLKALLVSCYTLSCNMRKLDRAALAAFEQVFGCFVDVWRTVKAEEVERERKRAELYKYRTFEHKIETEEERDEREFREQFPDYWSLFEDLDRNPEDDPADDEPAAAASGTEHGVASAETTTIVTHGPRFTIDEDLTRLLCYVHRSVYAHGSFNTCLAPPSDLDRCEAFTLSYTAATSLVQALSAISTQQLDRVSAGAHVVASSMLTRELQAQPVAHIGAATTKASSAKKRAADLATAAGGRVSLLTGEKELYSIYRDPNVPEAQLLLAPAAAMRSSVLELLAQWPDHPVLQSIVSVIDRISSLPVTSPLMTFITGIELLLRKGNEWEQYASKQVSIHFHLEEISRLVARWRKLELQSWPTLLLERTRRYEAKALESWFSLYGIIRSTRSDGSGDLSHVTLSEQTQRVAEASKLSVEQAWVYDISATIDSFLHGGTAGDFGKRLELLRAFQQELLVSAAAAEQDSEATASEVAQARRRSLLLSNVLYHLVRYYSLFGEEIERHFAATKQPLEKEIDEFIRLSRWENLGYYVLRDAADKSRRKLASFSRRFDKLLLGSVREHFNRVPDDYTEPSVSPSTVSTTTPPTMAQQVSWNWFGAATCASASEQNIPVDTLDQELKRSFALDDTNLLQNRGSALAKRMAQLVSNDIAGIAREARQRVTSSVDDVCVAIIERTTELRNEGRSRQEKQLALTELLRALAELGLSHRNSAHSPLQHDLWLWLQAQPIPDAVPVALDSVANSVTTSDSLLAWWAKADRYYYSGIGRVQQLRQLSLQASKDVSARQVQLGKGFLEHSLHLLERQRSLLVESSEQYLLLDRSVQLFGSVAEQAACDTSAAASSPSLPMFVDHTVASEQLTLHKALIDQFLELLGQGRLLLSSAMQVALESRRPIETELTQAERSVRTMQQWCIGALFHLCEHYQPCLVPPVRLVPRSVLTTVGKHSATMRELAASITDQLTAMEAFADRSFVDPLIGALRQLCVRLSDSRWELPQFQHDSSPEQEELTVEEADFARSFSAQLELVYSNTLLGIQHLRATTLVSHPQPKVKAEPEHKEPGTEPEDDDDEEEDDSWLSDNTIAELHTHLVTCLSDLGLSSLQQQISSLLELVRSFARRAASSAGGKRVLEVCGMSLGRLAPLLAEFRTAVQVILADFVAFHKTLAKLLHILSGVFGVLFTQGFCDAPDEPQAQQGDRLEEADGTGMGSGEGAKDVSKEIEDEEQLQKPERSQDDDPNKPPPEEEEDGMEASADFDGELFDVEDKKDQEKDDSDDDDDEQEDELDKGMGKLEREKEDVVDEKLWDDEEDEQPEDQDEGAEGSTLESDRQDEMIANEKEDDGNEQDDDKKKQKQDDDNKEQANDKNEKEEQDDEEEDHEAEDEAEGEMIDTREEESLRKDLEEEEEFELPDDLNIGGEQGDGDDENEEAPEDQEAVDGEVPEEETDMNLDEEDDDDEQGSATDEDDATKDNDAEQPDLEQEPDQGTEDQQGLVQEDDAERPEEEEEEDDRDKEEVARNLDVSKDNVETQDQQFGVRDNKGHAPEMQLDEEQQEQAEQDRDSGQPQEHEQQLMNQENDTEGEWNQRESRAQHDDTRRQDQRQQPQQLDPNPFRNLGDASKQWKRRLQMIERQQQQQQDEQDTKQQPDNKDEAAQPDEQQQYEYLHQDDATSVDDMQALAPATENQQADELARPDQDNMDVEDEDAEENDHDKSQDDTAQQPEDEANSSKHHEDVDETAPRTKLAPAATDDNEPEVDQQLEDEADDKNAQTVDEDDAMNEDDGAAKEFSKGDSAGDDDDNQDAADEEEENTDSLVRKLTPEDLHRMREELERTLNAWREDPDQVQLAAELWYKYESITESLAQELSELLRLILEPTLATKLKGDYRTGKRINMKKVIPYIASQFRKDKIWLRRSKPQKRNYRVMVAIDDSESMTHNQSGQLACEAMALIAKAMARLEVGELAIVKFGDDVSLVHPFDQPFTSEAGPAVIGNFAFDQQDTNFRQLLETSATIFESARAHSSQQDENLQLLIIISDGRITKQKGLHALIRQAEANHILPVFICIDSPDSKDSILNVQSITFGRSKPIRTFYIDDFPFPYYIVLRDINHLPDVLADALRQWFELMTQKN